MLSGDLWTVVLNPIFLITVGLVLLPFLPLAYSVWRTWEENRPRREVFQVEQLTASDGSTITVDSPKESASGLN